jgi:hypothetical protein
MAPTILTKRCDCRTHSAKRRKLIDPYDTAVSVLAVCALLPPISLLDLALEAQGAGGRLNKQSERNWKARHGALLHLLMSPFGP